VLYDLEKDPDELTNLANDPAADGVRKELEATPGEVDEGYGRFVAVQFRGAGGGQGEACTGSRPFTRSTSMWKWAAAQPRPCSQD